MKLVSLCVRFFLLLFGACFLSWGSFGSTADASPGWWDVERVSIADMTGAEGDLDSLGPEISHNGRYVAFISDASNLVPNDTNRVADGFVYDRFMGTTQRVSVDSFGTQADGDTSSISMSGDGRFVVFCSAASNLVTGDANMRDDVFLFDRAVGQTERISLTSSGKEANGRSEDARISEDGTTIVWTSAASNMVSGDADTFSDIYAYNRVTKTLDYMSEKLSGTGGTTANSFEATVSANGQYVAFASDASNLVDRDGNGQRDIFVAKTGTLTTERVSVDSLGGDSNGLSRFPTTVSEDGKYIAFESEATDLVSRDTNASYDIFLRDIPNQRTSRISLDEKGNEVRANSGSAFLSADGRYVTFGTIGSFVFHDLNNKKDVYVHDTKGGNLYKVSQAQNSFLSNGDSGSLSIAVAPSPISSDGEHVAFQSTATNLVTGDTNGAADIFVVDNHEPPITPPPAPPRGFPWPKP